MTSFLEALKKGTDAHKRAVTARVEIDELLAKASREIADFGNGSGLSLQIEPVDRPRTNSAAEPREKVKMITVKTPRGTRALLAELEFSELGFPVLLRWERHVERALDQEGFETALTALLSSAVTGEKIADLITHAQ